MKVTKHNHTRQPTCPDNAASPADCGTAVDDADTTDDLQDEMDEQEGVGVRAL
jgi:hypothetical protein